MLLPPSTLRTPRGRRKSESSMRLVTTETELVFSALSATSAVK
jgi:hypothetical protein